MNLSENPHMQSLQGIGGGAKIIVKSGQKNLQHIYRGLHKKLQANNKKI